MEKELGGLEKGLKVKIPLSSLRAILKKATNLKTHDDIHGY